MLSTTFCKVSKAIFTIGAFKIKQENFYSMERNYITLNFMWSNFFGEKNGCNKMANSLWNQHYMWNKSCKLLQVRKVVRFLIMEQFSFSLLDDELPPLATAQQISHLLFRKSSSTTQILLVPLDTVSHNLELFHQAGSLEKNINLSGGNIEFRLKLRPTKQQQSCQSLSKCFKIKNIFVNVC